MSNQIISLNLGCGSSHKEGFINIDLVQPCDMLLNIERDYYPWGDGDVEEIVAENAFVMIDNIRWAMNQCHRVLKSGGYLTVWLHL